MQETIGIYKAREMPNGEKVFHAPETATGNYYLVFNKTNGVVKYVPVHMVEVKG